MQQLSGVVSRLPIGLFVPLDAFRFQFHLKQNKEYSRDRIGESGDVGDVSEKLFSLISQVQCCSLTHAIATFAPATTIPFLSRVDYSSNRTVFLRLTEVVDSLRVSGSKSSSRVIIDIHSLLRICSSALLLTWRYHNSPSSLISYDLAFQSR